MQISNNPNAMVSVMMPTYNRSKYLEESVQSILGQSFRDFELLIYNDASTDGTAEWLENLQARDARVRVITALKNSGGCYLGRQVLLREARGKYLAVMDDDDLSLPERLRLQVEFLEAHPDVAVVGTQVHKFKGDKRPVRLPASGQTDCPHEELVAKLLFTLPFTHSTTMYRKSMIEGFSYPPYRTREDAMFFWMLASAGKRFACLPEVLLLYRQHPLNSCNLQSTDPDWSRHVAFVWRDLGMPESLIRHYPHLTAASYPRVGSGKKRDAGEKEQLRHSLLQLFVLYGQILKANRKSRLLDQAALKKLLSERWELHCRVYAKWIPTLGLYSGLLRRSAWYGQERSPARILCPLLRIVLRNLLGRAKK